MHAVFGLGIYNSIMKLDFSVHQLRTLKVIMAGWIGNIGCICDTVDRDT